MTSDPNILYGGDIENDAQYPSLGALLVDKFRKGGDKIGLIDGLTGKKWSYGELLKQSIRIAKALHGAGVRQNDKVAIICENRLEYPAIVYGTIYLNAIIVPTNYGYTENELGHVLSITKPKFIFLSALSQNITPKLKKVNQIERIILLDDDNVEDGKVIGFKKLIDDYANNDFDVEKNIEKAIDMTDQVAAIFMSSGTTGLPKGVQITHSNIAIFAINYTEKVPLMMALIGEVVILNIAPFFHVMGFMSKIMSIISSEFTFVFLAKFNPKLFLESIPKYNVSGMTIPPPIVHFLVKSPLVENYDLSSIKYIASAAAPLSKELQEQLVKKFNDEIIVIQGYGQTEATLGVLNSEPANLKYGSVGQLHKGAFAKVIDENGNTLGQNKIGEICIKGPYIMKGYVDNKDATATAIDADGWLHTGDLGYYDEDQQFFIVDRLKELIKYKGYQVPPAELEGLLISNPRIKDAGVIGVPNEVAGELPFAFVVKEDPSLSEQEVKDFVEKNVSNPKWLRGGVKFVDEIPKNPTGKILRREMRELYKSMKAKL